MVIQAPPRSPRSHDNWPKSILGPGTWLPDRPRGRGCESRNHRARRHEEGRTVHDTGRGGTGVEGRRVRGDLPELLRHVPLHRGRLLLRGGRGNLQERENPQPQGILAGLRWRKQTRPDDARSPPDRVAVLPGACARHRHGPGEDPEPGNHTAHRRRRMLEHCLEVEESSALKANERSTKVYALGVGLVLDDEVSIVSHGFASRAKPGSEHEPSNKNEGGEKP